MSETQNSAPSIEELQKLLQEQGKAFSALEKKMSAKEDGVSNVQKQLENLQKQHGNLEQTVSSQKATIDQQSKTIEALTNQLTKATSSVTTRKEDKVKLPKQTFIVDGRTFKFVAPVFTLGDKKMTALDALADKKILAALVEIKSGIIQEIF